MILYNNISESSDSSHSSDSCDTSDSIDGSESSHSSAMVMKIFSYEFFFDEQIYVIKKKSYDQFFLRIQFGDDIFFVNTRNIVMKKLSCERKKIMKKIMIRKNY